MKNIGENIKRIRLAIGISQKEIIDACELSKQGYINIEKGESVPSINTLTVIAKALGVKIDDLLREPLKLKSLRYRVMKVSDEKDKSKMMQDEIKLANWLENYKFLENQLNDYRPYLFDSIVSSCPKVAAAEARKLLNLGDREAINDIISLLEFAGVKIYLYSSALKQSFGMSVSAADGAYVVAVNTKDSIPIERQIFTAAHELGHLILHKNSYYAGEFIENDNEEKEANAFASHFLMPDDLFNYKLEETQGKHWVDRIIHTKIFFKVSYKTVLYRLIESGKANQDIYMKFNIDFKKKYNKDLKEHFEPFAVHDSLMFSKHDYLADRFNRLVKLAYEQDLITTAKAAELLFMSIAEFKDLSNSWSII